jgi:hypothetical protein
MIILLPEAWLCEFGSCFPLWFRLLGDSGSGRWVTVAG